MSAMFVALKASPKCFSLAISHINATSCADGVAALCAASTHVGQFAAGRLRHRYRSIALTQTLAQNGVLGVASYRRYGRARKLTPWENAGLCKQ
jgi:hypothetical protein